MKTDKAVSTFEMIGDCLDQDFLEITLRTIEGEVSILGNIQATEIVMSYLRESISKRKGPLCAKDDDRDAKSSSN